MSRELAYTIACDGPTNDGLNDPCPDTAEITSGCSDDAEFEATAAGWRLSPHVDRCPQCLPSKPTNMRADDA